MASNDLGVLEPAYTTPLAVAGGVLYVRVVRQQTALLATEKLISGRESYRSTLDEARPLKAPRLKVVTLSSSPGIGAPWCE